MKVGQQWTRVTGPNLKPQNAEKAAANKSRLADEKFLSACKEVSIEATKRQASKWNNKKGAAYKHAHHIV